MKSGAALLALCVSGVWLAQEPVLPVTVAAGPPMRMTSARLVEVTLRFDRPMPASMEVVRLVRDRGAWKLGSLAHRPVHPLSREMTVAGAPTIETLLLLRASGLEGYLLDGPFRWPHEPSIYFVSPRWRRTLRGRWPRTGLSPPRWIASQAASRPDPWPQCTWTSDAEWECLGVPLFEPGLVVTAAGAQLTLGEAAVGEQPQTVQAVSGHPVTWARLIIVRPPGPVGSAAGATITLVEDRTATGGALGLAVQSGSVTIRSLGRGVFLASGTTRPDGGWIEIAQAGMTPARVPLSEVMSGRIETALQIALERSPEELPRRSAS